MLAGLNAGLDRWLGRFLAAVFAVLIFVVFLQVMARNVLELPLIWTLDVAQLLFAWCIFVGAALAFRRGGHYVVDLWPAWPWIQRPLALAATLAGATVIGILFHHGVAMTRIGLNRMAPSIGISEFWFFLPIPLGVALMALFLLERIVDGRAFRNDDS